MQLIMPFKRNTFLLLSHKQQYKFPILFAKQLYLTWLFHIYMAVETQQVESFL